MYRCAHFSSTYFPDLNILGTTNTIVFYLSSFGSEEGSDATQQKGKGLPRIASVPLAKPTLFVNVALELPLGLALQRWSDLVNFFAFN